MAALQHSTDHQTQAPYNISQTGDSVVRAQNTLQRDFTNYKSILQHYAQKSRLLLPTYVVSNEGFAHLPQFRATVIVGEKQYTSPNLFFQRKAAEQNAAKFALDNIAPTVDDEEPLPNIQEYSFFCKSILYEFAVKMDFDKPTYNTYHPDPSLLAFKSVISLNGMSYTGELGRNKKEAEQLAACAAVLSILESEHKNAISEIIKPKAKMYAKLYKVQDTCDSSTTNSPSGVSIVAPMNNVIGSSLSSLPVSSAQAPNPPYHDAGKGVLMTNDDGSPQSGSVQLSSAQVVNPPNHEFNKPVVQSSAVSIAQPITFVPPSVHQYVHYVQSCGQKRKRNKKKAKKHAQVGVGAPVALMHPSQVPSCPMAQ